MTISLHHAHLMASDAEATIEFWRRCFGAVVVADEAMAGSRNVLLDVGGGRLNLYDQPPNQRGPVNHLGVRVDDLEAVVAELEAAGWAPRPIRSAGSLSYSMVEGPDRLLIEVFSFDPDTTPQHLRPYFDLSTSAANLGVVEGPGPFMTELSPAARERLERPQTEALRPPPVDDLDAVFRWRQSVHQAWLYGDPPAEASGHRRDQVAGVHCLRVGERHAASPLVIYCHGGGFALGSPEVAVPITGRLADGVEVLSVGYRLAPEHPYPAGLNDLLAVAAAIAESGRPYVLAGDSAGASLALSAAMTAIGSAAPPAGLILLSPHLVARRSDRTHLEQGPGDPRSDVDEVTAQWLSDAYRGSLPADAPELSPGLADDNRLVGLPSTLIQVGTLETGLSAAARLAKRLASLGIDTTLDVWPDLWHTWHYHRDLPEADRALAEVVRFVQRAAGDVA